MENKNVENQNSLITRTTPQITVFFESIDRMLDKVEMLAKKKMQTYPEWRQIFNRYGIV